MDPSTSPDGDSQPGRRPLPPELEFLRQPPPLNLEAEELIDFVRQQHALIHQHADLIRQHGMDPQALLATTEQGLRNLEESCRACDESELKVFHAIADSADAERALFKAMKTIVDKQHAERPFDHDVQEMKEFMDEWQKHMPKE